MKKYSIEEILASLVSARVGVVGDFCLDVYWQIDSQYSEESIETQLMTKPVVQQRYSLGGAGNVAANLASLEVAKISLFGVIGDDPFGTKLKSLAQAVGADTHALMTQEENWNTHTYIKPIENQMESNRIDFGNTNILSRNTADNLLSMLNEAVDDLDIVIVNQQVTNGIHTDYFQKELIKLIELHANTIFIVDSRDLNDVYSVGWHKMNDIEATRLCGFEYQSTDIILKDKVQEAAYELYEKWNTPLFITRGARGCIVIDKGEITEIPGLLVMGKLDTVGAGDSMLAGIAASLASNLDCTQAATLGNFVAAVTVQKVHQTGTASHDEIRAIGTSPNYIYEPEKAEDIRHANYWQDSEIEIVEPWNYNLPIKHIIFDHDGTLSTLREGWENVMKPMMMKAILGDLFNEADETLYHRVKQRVSHFIDETTGIQTLVQMKELIELVKEFNCVPHNQILDEHGYKKIYNDDLMEMVKERIKKLNKGELNAYDFAIKGAHQFVETCFNSGIKLYLASGTDEHDVVEEANAMGYGNFFEGRIYGAIGDITKEAKRIVMDRIIKDIGAENSHSIATIGDGPVEIREMRKSQGLAVGIASDELRRFSLNRTKRTRLIRAGAQIIIPDYSQTDQLCDCLNIELSN